MTPQKTLFLLLLVGCGAPPAPVPPPQYDAGSPVDAGPSQLTLTNQDFCGLGSGSTVTQVDKAVGAPCATYGDSNTGVTWFQYKVPDCSAPSSIWWVGESQGTVTTVFEWVQVNGEWSTGPGC